MMQEVFVPGKKSQKRGLKLVCPSNPFSQTTPDFTNIRMGVVKDGVVPPPQYRLSRFFYN